jgi:hypothetical protein
LRQSTIKRKQASAREMQIAPKTFELEQRISRLEVCCASIDAHLVVLKKLITGVQAQLDHLDAKTNR